MFYNWLIGLSLVASVILLFRFVKKPGVEETKIESILEILEKSYAKGDISIEDYLELKETLNQKIK
tara:strand:+ start:4007 stop:4204 length:198 start_codon:yes stop_codon:yes gene_type:complete